MVLVLRYALLVVLAVVSALAFVGASTALGERVFGEAGAVGAAPGVGFWVIVVMGAGVGLSLTRSVFSEMPGALLNLWDGQKERVFTLALGAIVCAVFILG